MNFFNTIIELNKCNSTMSLADNASKFVTKPFVIRSDIQTEGYGQYGRKWFSPEGGVWMTQVFDLNNPQGLSTFMAIPILRALKKYSNRVCVKWPNDVLLENKKIAGILTEIKGNTAFVGIGVNVSNAVHEELKEIANSLENISNIKPLEFFQELIDFEEPLIKEFITSGFSPFRQEYEENLIFMNKMVEVESKQRYLGKATGVSDIGELILETNDNIVKISSGTVLNFYQLFKNNPKNIDFKKSL